MQAQKAHIEAVLSGEAREKNITRLAGNRGVGWWVRIYRTTDGQQCCTSQLFSDSLYDSSRHDGKRRALIAAIAWRDEQLGLLGPPARCGAKASANPPGYGTIRRVESHYRPKLPDGTFGERRYFAAWVAWLRIEGGKSSGTKWSIDRWGEEQALENTQRWMSRARSALRKRLGVKRLPAVDLFLPEKQAPAVAKTAASEKPRNKKAS